MTDLGHLLDREVLIERIVSLRMLRHCTMVAEGNGGGEAFNDEDPAIRVFGVLPGGRRWFSKRWHLADWVAGPRTAYPEAKPKGLARPTRKLPNIL